MSNGIDLAYIQRVLESDAPQEDRDRAAQMMRDMRRDAMRSGMGELGAQAVAYWAAVNKDGEIEYSCNADDANDGEFARDLCNQHINGRLNEGGNLLRLKALYGTQSAEIARLSAALAEALAQLEAERARNAGEPVAWMLEWTCNGEERGQRLYDDERHCIFDAESDGGVVVPLLRGEPLKTTQALAVIPGADQK